MDQGLWSLGLRDEAWYCIGLYVTLGPDRESLEQNGQWYVNRVQEALRVFSLFSRKIPHSYPCLNENEVQPMAL